MALELPCSDRATAAPPAPREGTRAVSFVSVVMPVRNEERFIARTLDALLSQDFPRSRMEILVVDGESTDRTRDVVRALSASDDRISLHENPKRWSSAARNIGARAARGDVVLIVDGHCEIRDRKHLAKLVAAFERSGADCIGRPQPLDVSNASRTQQAIALARSSRLGHHPDSYIYSDREMIVPAHSVAVAYRRTVFNRVGYFDERFDACEDVELNHRLDLAGLRCLLSPEAAVRYEPRGTFRGLFRQMTRYGRGRVRLMRKHRELTSLKSLLPGVFLAGLVVGPVAGWFSPPLWIAYLSAVACYALIVATASMLITARERRPLLAPLAVCAFLSIHLGAGWGILREMLAGSRMD